MTLGRERDSVSPTGVNPDVAIDSRGRFYTWSTSRSELLVYDADGAFRSKLSRSGKGPGEISGFGTKLLVGPGDSLHVFFGGQYAVFDSSGNHVRSVPVGFPPFGPPVLLGDGRAVIAAALRSPETIGFGIHVLAPDGMVLRSFAGSGEFNARCLQCVEYRINSARSAGQIWIVPPNTYEIHRVDIAGHTLQVINVIDSWFEKSVALNRPNVAVRAVLEDTAGLLWIIANPDQLPPLQSRGGVAFIPDSVRDKTPRTTRTVVDVIDPVRGVLVATTTISGHHWPFGDGLLAKPRNTATGNVAIDVFRLKLVPH